jgi:Pvc16 N-terminal domain
MAGYKALAAVGRSLVALLDQRFRDDIPTDRRPTPVLVGTVDLDRVNTPGSQITYPAVAVYCYRLSVDSETRPKWSAVASQDGVPRLPLRMHLLITAFDEFVDQELEWLGLAARALESESILTGPLLDSSGEWGPGEAIQVVPDDMALESMSEAFQALTTDFRLYLLYQARVVVIGGRREGDGERVTTVAAGLGGAAR